MHLSYLNSPAAVCRKLCDRTQGAEGPLRAAVRQSRRVTVDRAEVDFSVSKHRQTQHCKNKQKKSHQQPSLRDPPDFEEVIEGGIAIVAQGVFIFQILRKTVDDTRVAFPRKTTDRPVLVHTVGAQTDLILQITVFRRASGSG